MSERFFPDSMPPPMADATTLPWWQAASEHRLVVQRCAACGHTRLPPAPVCPACRSDAADWQEVPGRGEVYTYIEEEIEEGYAVAAIDLDAVRKTREELQLIQCRVPTAYRAVVRKY